MDDTLSSIVERLVGLSRSNHRLARYSFTYFGMYFLKYLLVQYKELNNVRSELIESMENGGLTKA